MTTSAEVVRVSQHLKITCYITTVPTLVFWSGITVKILIQKDIKKVFWLIVICVLMRVF